MLVLAQRWVTGVAGDRRFGRPVVEALVIARRDQEPGEDSHTNFAVYSAFYDAAAGKDLRDALLWHDRGRYGMLPGLPSLALDILRTWALPHDEAYDLGQYVKHLETLHDGMKALDASIHTKLG